MSDPLGLSIGTTNLVAASVGHQPVIRRSVLTLFGHAAPEVGAPGNDSADTDGVVLSGFVDRVGDPVPLVATDGATYSAEQLLVEALESMAGLALPSLTSTPDLVIAVPSYWSPAMSSALKSTLAASEILAPGGVAPRLIPDAVAALTALDANPGIDRHGTVALLDFGGGGTSITLADAAAAFDVIDGTVRIPEFAGDQIDQALLSHLLEGITGDGDADPGQTTAVGSLALLREQCRYAKERLSGETDTELTVDLPGGQVDIRVTRAELEDLIDRPLSSVLTALEDMLGRNNISWSAVSTVVLVGGGAGIPLIERRLSERSQARVVTTPQPALDAGAGAALFAAHGGDADTATGIAPAAPAPALAWSQDDESDDVVPYTGAVAYSGAVHDVPADAAPSNRYGPADGFRPTFERETAARDDVKLWQRLPMSVFGTAAAVALVAVGGVAIALTSVEGADREQPKPGIAPLSSAFVPSGPTGETVTLNNQPVQPSPEPTAPAVPPSVVVTTPPPTTAPPTTITTTSTTTSPTTTTATTTATTTSTTTTTTSSTTTTATTTPATTAPTTTAPPATTPTTATPTTAVAVTTTAPTAPALGTSYLTVPFLPEPIPIPVLESP